MFRVYLFYVERKKDRITDVRLFINIKRKRMHIYMDTHIRLHWYVIENRFVIVLFMI
jgi:hypothetical protein